MTIPWKTYSLFKVERIQGVSVVTPENLELRDEGVVHDVMKQLHEFVDDERPTRVIINFERLEPKLIPSLFIGALFATKDRISKFGGEIGLCGMSPLLAEAIRIMDAKTQVFQRFDTLADAWEAFRRESP